MIFDDNRRLEFEEYARPLVKWLCENCHPPAHVTVLITPTRTELTAEGVCLALMEGYIRD